MFVDFVQNVASDSITCDGLTYDGLFVCWKVREKHGVVGQALG